MTGPNRKGFTLVELLVVVVIIGMLVGLLVPALNSSRRSARLTQCLNNQHELASAVQQYETAKGHLPGYTNRLGQIATNLTWCQVSLAYLGRNDVWEILRKGNLDSHLNELPKVLPQFICPDDKREMDFALSYVGNCGQYTGADTCAPAGGLFLKRDTATAPKMTTSKIRDGAQNTILFSENLQASQWTPLKAARLGSGIKSRVPFFVDVGLIWTNPLDTACYETTPSKTAGSAPINACLDDAAIIPWTATADTDDAVLAFRHYARPSSAHAGLVVVTYADGHQDTLNENIEESVYLQLLDPAGP